MARIVRLVRRRPRSMRRRPPEGRCPPLQVWLLSPPSPETDDLAASLDGFRALRVRVVAPGDLADASGTEPPRIVLMDRSIGERAVLDAARALRERHPETPLVLLGGGDDPRSMADIVLRSGAGAFADPGCGVEHIARQILAALAGVAGTDRSAC